MTVQVIKWAPNPLLQPTGCAGGLSSSVTNERRDQRRETRSP